MKWSVARFGFLLSPALVLGTPIARGGDGPICPDCSIEVHAIADAALFNRLGAGTDQYIRDVIEGMKAVWSLPTDAGGMGVGVMLGELTINQAGDPWAASTDPTVLLPNVLSYVSANIPINPNGRDVVLVFSGLDFDGSTTGLSFVGGLCDATSVGVLETNRFSIEWDISQANHQLGHLAGAQHDGTGNACATNASIMSPSANPSNPFTTFSACSVAYFESLIQNANVDILECLALPGAVCLADLNGDGMLNFFDVSAFLSAFNAMNPIADFTGDGQLNFFDVSAFLSAFNAGCP